jgi:hypothetical protein
MERGPDWSREWVVRIPIMRHRLELRFGRTHRGAYFLLFRVD